MPRRDLRPLGDDAAKASASAPNGDRRFICSICGTKWYVPASRRDSPDPERCGSCDGGLLPYVGPQPAPA